ncbi:MAG: hypothetical protein NTX99_01920 [Candidatus Aminicenantes bacterium]|nr:hypothetical protein [Candidatus Aminicenantes bacterium]
MKIIDPARLRNGAAALGRLALAAMMSSLMAGPVMGGDAQDWSAGFSLAARSGGEAPAAAGRTIALPRTAGGRDGILTGSGTRPVSRGEAGQAQRPPVKTGKVAAQILAGVGVTGGMFALSILTASEGTLDDDEAMRRRATTWMVFGGAVLTPLVVYLIGNHGPQQGSLGKTYLYGVVGAAAGGLLLYLAFESDTETLGILALTCSTLAPAVGAVIGYNASRRYDSPPQVQASLLSVTGGKLRLGIPAPQVIFSGLGRKSPGLAVRIFQAEL